jgi:uncharacterized protein (TIGR02246 family)
VIVGSTRPSRRGPVVADWVAAASTPGLKLDVVDVADFDLPLLDEPAPAISGEYARPATVKFSRLISEFDAYVLVTPEYNHSTSGALKNALDHLYSEWQDKPVAFVGYGIDGGTRAVEHLRTICAELGMAGVGPQVSLDLREDFVEGSSSCAPRERQGQARDRMLETLTRWATALRTLRQEPKEDGGADAASRPALDQTALRPAAEAAVDQFIAGIQAGLDTSDAGRYDAQFAHDVIWGSPYGATVAGIDSISAAHRSLMADGIGSSSRYELVQALAPAPGVALAQVRRQAADEGEGTFSEMALYVLVERGGRWWLAAGQNTRIAERPSR